ncbi:MAG: DUF4105 domain-containing protein [Endomicrobiaceae bacterium]
MANKKLIVVLFLLFSSLNVFAVTKEELVNKITDSSLYNNQTWKRLLLYSNGKSIVNKNSHFFISKNGYKNPKEEMFALVNEIFNGPQQNNFNIFYKYPARIRFIERSLNISLQDLNNNTDNAEFEEFKKRVPADNIYLVFASENNQSPSSMMGHLFIKISGYNGIEHAITFTALVSDKEPFKFYLKALTNNLPGGFILNPYKNIVSRYISEENRSLWEFEITLTEEEKELFLLHLWELKEVQTQYKFITYNCATATIDLLKTAKDKDFLNSAKPFNTPVDYLKEFDRLNLISKINLLPTKLYSEKMKKHKLNILDADKSSSFSISYGKSTEDFFEFQITPISQNLIEPSMAYYDDLETKLFDITADYVFNTDKLFIKTIDLIKLQSILDCKYGGLKNNISKYFSISFENSLGDTTTNLNPTIDYGMGIAYSFYNGKIIPYFMPRTGYRYRDINNFFLVPEIGIIIKPVPQLKIIATYDKYFNSYKNNRGFDSKLSLKLGFKITENNILLISYSEYTNINIDTKNLFSLGFAVHF